MRPGWISRWELAVATAAVSAAVVAVWLTLRADFLAHPGWLAAQKADMIVGPVFVGLYWRRRRPGSPFATLLIAVGFLSATYLLQSSPTPWAFSLGVVSEGLIYVSTLALILAFPTGRLDGLLVRLMLAAGIAGACLVVVIVLIAPAIAPDGSISGCRTACPENGLLVSANASLALQLRDVSRVIIVVNAVAALALIAHRFAVGTPPRRRALAIGAPIAVCFLVTQAAYQTANLLGQDAGAAQWAIVISRAMLWYGFLLALVAAELFAARVLRQIVEASLRRPSLGELEAMLRVPLGDPQLRLGFWHAERGTWGDDGDFIPDPASGRVLTTIERDDRPAVAIVHDPELAADPELMHAAGAVALLAQENTRLETAWEDSLRELRDSRARIAAAGDIERRALERDLHDGAQQQLTSALIRLSMLRDLVADASAASAQVDKVERELELTVQELRRLSHGIYPTALATTGIVKALEDVVLRSPTPVELRSAGIGRYPPEVESAVYFCCLEALQNATKHAGPGARVLIRLDGNGRDLRFRVSDEGAGFKPLAASHGVGLRNMRDRLDAFDGRLEITSAPGRGTTISGTLPITERDLITPSG